MVDLSKIKSQKLKDLMTNSIKFNALDEKRQESMVGKISALSVEKQEEAFLDFFEKENKEEEPIRQKQGQAMGLLMEKVYQVDKTIKRLARMDKEEKVDAQEDAEAEKLISELR